MSHWWIESDTSEKYHVQLERESLSYRLIRIASEILLQLKNEDGVPWGPFGGHWICRARLFFGLRVRVPAAFDQAFFRRA